MDITYKMIGADGQQYGPATTEQFKLWVQEGRVRPATQVMRSDSNSWLLASQYSELGLNQPPASPGTPPAISSADAGTVLALANLNRRVRSGAGWFYLIGAVSVVNSIVVLTGYNWRFVFGLGITDIIAAFSGTLGPAGMAVSITLDLLVLGLFLMFGFFAARRHVWSFVAGIFCYAVDSGLLLLLHADMLNLIVHGIALVFMIQGLVAAVKLNSLQRSAAARI